MSAEVESPLAARLAGLLRELRQSQWMKPDDILAGQHRRLVKLATYCVEHSPFFRARLEACGLVPVDLGTVEGFRCLRPFNRRDLQSAHGFYCETIPQGHAPITETRTSGSTGEPVMVRRTGENGLYWHAFTMRDHFWHGRDFAKRFAAIRPNIPQVHRASDWGRPATFLFKTGPSLVIPITAAIEEQFDLIRDFAPAILLAYPSILAALIGEGMRRDVRLNGIEHLRTIGETLSPDVRAKAKNYFGLDITDAYSSQEMGYIALQCPQSANYHVMAEAVIVEVLRKDGTVCGANETGRIVVTDLRNFATPMIRYEIGDWGQTGTQCVCGRGLPTLARIFGRERNLILMPDGTRHWPLVGFDRFRDLAPIRQYQFVQTGRQNIEVRLAVERPLAAEEEAALASHIQKALGHPFALNFVYFDGAIPAGAGGKFEEFVCKV